MHGNYCSLQQHARFLTIDWMESSVFHLFMIITCFSNTNTCYYLTNAVIKQWFQTKSPHLNNTDPVILRGKTQTTTTVQVTFLQRNNGYLAGRLVSSYVPESGPWYSSRRCIIYSMVYLFTETLFLLLHEALRRFAQYVYPPLAGNKTYVCAM